MEGEVKVSISEKIETVVRKILSEELNKCSVGKDHERRLNEMKTDIQEGFKGVYEKLDGFVIQLIEGSEKKKDRRFNWSNLVVSAVVAIIVAIISKA